MEQNRLTFVERIYGLLMIFKLLREKREALKKGKKEYDFVFHKYQKMKETFEQRKSNAFQPISAAVLHEMQQ